MKDKLLKHLFLITIFTVFTLLIFYPFVFSGMILKGNQDRMDQNVPAIYYYYRTFHSLELPEWNPYILCGTSGLGNAYNAFFYPFLLFSFLFIKENTIPVLLTFLVMSHFFFVLLFSYIFFNSLFNEKIISITSSIIYGFSGAILYNLSIGLTNILCFTYFPLLLFFATTHEKRSYQLNIILNSIALSLLFSAGNPQIIIYILLIYLTYYSYLVIENTIKNKTEIIITIKEFFAPFISLFLAFMLTSLRILPFYYWKKFDESQFSLNNFYSYLENYKIDPIELIRLFVPHFLGIFDGYLGKRVDFYESIFSYIGVLPLFISLFVIFFSSNKKIWYFRIIFIFIILTIIGSPITIIHYLITKSNTIYFTRIYYMLPLVCAVLTGYGLQELKSYKKKFKNFIIFFVLFSFFIFMFLVFYYSIKKNNIPQDTYFLMRKSIIYFIIITVIYILLCLFMYYKNFHLILPFLISFILIDVYTTNYINDVKKYLFTKDSLFITEKDTKKIKSVFDDNNKLFRINDMNRSSNTENIGEDENNCNNMNIVFNYYVPYGYDNIINKKLIKLYNFTETPTKRIRKIWPRDIRSCQLTSSLIDMRDDKLFFINKPIPRYKLFNNYIVLEGENEIIKKLKSENFDYYNTLILKEKPHLNIDKKATGEIISINEKFNKIDIELICNENMLLLINDTFESGWKAKIDGKEVSILEANLLFKAIEVPKGRHKVLLNYKHKGINQALLLTISGVLILLILIFQTFYKKFQFNI